VAVRKTLEEDYVGRGFMQPVEEVEWRNIGFCLWENRLRAVAFDISHVRLLSDGEDGSQWVEACIKQLRDRR
jgi:hypothetical protein